MLGVSQFTPEIFRVIPWTSDRMELASCPNESRISFCVTHRSNCVAHSLNGLPYVQGLIPYLLLKNQPVFGRWIFGKAHQEQGENGCPSPFPWFNGTPLNGSGQNQAEKNYLRWQKESISRIFTLWGLYPAGSKHGF
jgi:hypothetical protein